MALLEGVRGPLIKPPAVALEPAAAAPSRPLRQRERRSLEKKGIRASRTVILIRYIPQYRLPFFMRLHELCVRSGIDLTVVYGNPGPTDSLRGDSVDFPHGLSVQNRYFGFGGRELIWQPALSCIHKADLVIVEQQNKLLINYLLLARQLLGWQRVAFFGHGRNFQAKNRNSLSERFKKRLALLPHWWFVYTEGGRNYVRQLGYPAERVTVFQNAIDTAHLVRFRREITDHEIRDVRVRYNITSENVCIYIGSMVHEKRMGFLIEACKRIKARVPDFTMLFVGTGPDSHIVKDFCRTHPWAIYLGPLFDREKVKYCSMAKLLLMPGAVGLAILDAFAMRIPVLTTNTPYHGPEIEYLVHGQNGLMVAPSDDLEGYASATAALLKDDKRLMRFADNCEQWAQFLTVENMAKNFHQGIVRALSFELEHPDSPQTRCSLGST